MKQKRFDYVGVISGKESLPSGALRIPATLTRTGVFAYQRQDGSTVRELRKPQEVFDSVALKSFAEAPVTIGHPGRVTAENWRSVSVGHVSNNVRKDGSFVAADVVISDAEALAAIERGELVELSCGYECDVIAESGEYEGERYDAIQTHIVGNHVALGPSDWGRAGPDVRLKLDGVGDVAYARTTNDSLQESDQQKTTEKMEPKNTESAEQVQVIPIAEFEKVTAERDSLVNRLAALEQLADPAKIDSKVKAKVELREKARKLVSDSFDGLSDREIQVKAITKADPSFKADGRSDEYVSARFDIECDRADAVTVADSKLREVADKAGKSAPRSDADDPRTKMIERNKNLWKGSK